MSMRVIKIIIILSVFFVSCAKDAPYIPSDKNSGYDYFPLTTGNSLIYKIVEITIDKPSNFYDTTIYHLKEIIDIPFVDNEGDTAYRIERYRKNENDINWVIDRVWSAKLTKSSAEKVEENQRIVKIRFPIKLNLIWNGNLYNDLESQQFEISAIDHSYHNEHFSSDSCLTVIQDSSESLIHKDLSYEIYASGLGLVYKEKTYINSQEILPGVPIEQRVTTATIFKQELTEIENQVE